MLILAIRTPEWSQMWKSGRWSVATLKLDQFTQMAILMYSKVIFDIINQFYAQKARLEKCTYGFQCQFLHWEGQIGLA